MYINVLTSISAKAVDKTFTYHVPDNLIERVKIGIRVLIPFGNQKLEGFVLEVNVKTELDNVKDIIDVLDDEVVLTDELLDLGLKMKDMYLSTLISCYQVMLPRALKANKNNKINKKFEKYVKLIDNNYLGNIKQNEIIRLLKNKDVKLSELNKISTSSVKTLVNKKVIEIYEEEVFRKKYEVETIEKKELTKMQKKVYNDIVDTDKKIILLHGVTGSGKTEIYMELIENCLKSGKTAIMLVPEISLTEQIISRFTKRFGCDIAVLHSRLSDGEKYDEYRRIRNGEVKIVIGARSAVFAPLKNIGLIIIDEEHTSSFKQDSNPKYHALDIAKLRMNYHDLKVVLGTATPNLDTYARCRKDLYKLVELKQRVNNLNMPSVQIVDMNKEVKRGNIYFSNPLLNKLNETLDNGQQAMILINRRGYSSFITCKNCGYVSKCPNCDITLTYHKSSNTLRCHYCGYGTKTSEICPSCKEKSMSSLGLGTEKVEEELRNLFPNKKILRMDLDTTSKKGSHAKIIESFKNHEYDILVGTQMIAKGLDFPLVTLVGVINADTTLNIPSFKSNEETFQLLSQVAGRSGRSKLEGSVIIQTYNPDHFVFNHVVNHDYESFYKDEMNIRKKLGYPPYYYLVSIKVLTNNYDLGREKSNEIASILRKYLTSSIILGPAPHSIFKINNTYRFQLIIKYKKEDKLYEVLNKIDDHYRKFNNLKIDIDFNPNNI